MNDKKLLRDFFCGYSDSAYRYLGCHPHGDGFVFRVWAPNAKSVRLVGRFNNWDRSVPPMERRNGLFEEVSHIAKIGDEYKYLIERQDGSFVMKADPYAFHACTPPETASRVYDIEGYAWQDAAYRRAKGKKDLLASPVNIYEMHLGSWIRYKDGNPYSYTALADDLVPYLQEMGYTHVELLPVSEHPFDGSWGYQVTGYFAPTSRYGTPHDFMAFVDKCHKGGIGVILDWVGAHFPKDEHGLYEFDGTCCYESRDPARRENPEWGTRLFDFGRNEVRSFLLSSIAYWIREYHVDGIRCDAVSHMLYYDYFRDQDCWRKGDNVNSDAVSLLREINRTAFGIDPRILMIAEEATAFPKVTKPDYDGGLGFNLKWNMGWMHDTLDYTALDPLARKHHHDKMTFSLTYAFTENYVLPFSHDEVVHGKKSLLDRMPGDYDSKFQGLRTLLTYQMAHPGKKLNFMGYELGHFIEWDEKRELDWFLLQYDRHRQVKDFVRDLNRLYRAHPPLWNDGGWDGFSWVKVDDRDNSVFAFRRISKKGEELLFLFNFCPVLREQYPIGLPEACRLTPILSSDDTAYGGRGTPLLAVKTEKKPFDGQPHRATLTLPPLSAVVYKRTHIKR